MLRKFQLGDGGSAGSPMAADGGDGGSAGYPSMVTAGDGGSAG